MAGKGSPSMPFRRRFIMAKQNDFTFKLGIGDVIYVDEACLPPLVISAYYPEGENEGDPPTYIAHPLQSLSNFSRADKEAGIPGCSYIRNTDWIWRDLTEGEEEDLVITSRTIRLFAKDTKDFSEGVHVVGKVSNRVFPKLQEKILDLAFDEDSPFHHLTEEDLRPRKDFDSAIDLALTNIPTRLS